MIRKISKIFTREDKIYLSILFIILLLYSFYSLTFLCKFFPKDTFDSQLAIFWDYTAIHNLIPNIDIMYPYGFLFYYKNISLIFSFIYILLFPIIALLILISFRKIARSKVSLYVTFLSLIIFVLRYTGIEVFSRYGLLLGMSIILTFIYRKYLYIPKPYSLLFGCLIGLIFSIINDVGFYISILFIFLTFFIPVFDKGLIVLKRYSYYTHQISTIVLFLFGFIVGLIPVILLLIGIKNIPLFIQNSRYLVDFPTFTKTPFLPSLRSVENMFNFSVVISTISLLSYKTIILKEKNNFLSCLRICILFSLFLLLQKSVIRSMDIQITFFGFTLYLLLIIQISNFLKKRISPILFYLFFLLSLYLPLFGIGLRTLNTTSIYIYKPIDLNLIKRNFRSFLINKQSMCLSQNMSLYKENKTYKDIVNYIKNSKIDNPLIFDYLTNPIFYALLNQKSPFYFEIFGSSPSYAQQRTIKELDLFNTEFIILNTNTLRLKDNVPDYMRTYLLLKYALNSFIPIGKIDNYYILKRYKNNDFFESNLFKKDTDLQNYLLNIDFNFVPLSEGIYKNKYLLKSEFLVSGSTGKINQYLTKREINSYDTFLIVNSKETSNKKSDFIILESGENIKTKISFDGCSFKNICIINLSRIPVFYKVRILKKIYPSKTFNGSFQLIKTTNKIFW